jgi:quaternary ammonium compound-resistance protein SugE
MAWIWLTLAGLLEVVWAIGLKYTNGFGAVGVAILGIILFNEPRDVLRIASILLIVAGIAGLKLVSP